MKGLFWVGLIGFAFGMLVAPKKGTELRSEMKEQSNSVWDTIFYLVALVTEAPRPRYDAKMPDAAKKLEHESDEQRQAAEAMNRIKNALDSQDRANDGNHVHQVAS